MRMSYNLFLLLHFCSSFALSGHIIGLANYDYVSHNRVLWKLGRELQKRGHKYTQILPSCFKETYHDVGVEVYNTSVTSEEIEAVTLKLVKVGELTSIFAAFRLWDVFKESRIMTKRFCEDLFEATALIAELKKTVDLVLCDVTNVCCSMLVEMLNVTRVDVAPTGFSGQFGSMLFGLPQGAIYLTQEGSSEPVHSGTFSFTNRLVSFLSSHIMWYSLLSTIPEDLWEKYAKPNSRYTNIFDVVRTHSLALIPHDFALEYPRPHGANIKVIGPILPGPPHRLPDEFNQFMSENKQVILVSFGTTLSRYRPELLQVFANGLSKLPHSVLWKHSGKTPDNLGSNIKVVPWVPQNDILGHPSTKVFVSHVGLNSFLESVYHSVPIVAVPLFGDQHRQGILVKLKRLGITLDKNVMKPEDLSTAVLEVLNNPMYKANAVTISSIIKDRRLSPTEEGADWIEYALQHDGASHLISEVIDLPEYQLYMFDVFLFLLVMTSCFAFMFLYLCLCIFRRALGTASKEKLN